MKFKGPLAAAVGLCAIALGAAVSGASCSSNPVNVPVRTFELPQKLDVLCLQVNAPDPNNPGAYIGVPPVALPQSECAPTPPNADTTQLPNHLYALVTQKARGELAIVDLTAGNVVDEDVSTPGINFIPVGGNPTDVAVTPDGQLGFVAAAEPNKPAIYAVPGTRIIGNSQGLPAAETPPPLLLTDLPVCELPQVPLSLAVVPRPSSAAADGGPGVPYELVAVLQAGDSTAKVITIDPAPFLSGAGIDGGEPGTVPPGSLVPCPITGAVELSGNLPSGWTPGPPWSDGVPYEDGGVDLTGTEAPLPSSCTAPAPVDGGPADASGGVADASTDASADASTGPPAPDGGYALAFGPHGPPRPVASAIDTENTAPVLYVSDDELPIIHVIDLSTPGAPREREPLLATSSLEPTRKVSVGGLAVSESTRDYHRYLYAIDSREGDLLIYDITDPGSSVRTPLTRPHPELNPFQPPDRLVFGAPVAAVAFVEHDWPLTSNGATQLLAAKTGLLCNPNPNLPAVTDGPAVQYPPFDPTSDLALGGNYRANAGNQQVGLGPSRLRGIFGFATLSNGTLAAIDVDDWDAPCRRPDPMNGTGTPPLYPGAPTSTFSSLDVPEAPPAKLTDFDPYHAPVAWAGTGDTPVSLEEFFPVIAPHRPRSLYLLTNDPVNGTHIPNLAGLPQLYSQNQNLPSSGQGGLANPLLLPTNTGYADPSVIANPTEPNPALRTINAPSGTLPCEAVSSTVSGQPGISISWEDPTVQIDQNWQVTYEGQLPNFGGIAAPVEKEDGCDATNTCYQGLSLSVTNGGFCRLGIEDQALAQTRVAAELAEMQRLGIPQPDSLARWTGDYIEVEDDLLVPTDPYWQENGDDCWDPNLEATPTDRYNQCLAAFGTAANADSEPSRDFPILEAYDDHLVIGRWGYVEGSSGPLNYTTTNRVIVGRDPSNVAFLEQMRCCFHHEVGFAVRTGGEWVAIGSSSGYLHHVVADTASTPAGRCIQSCSPREQLLNSRSPDVPRTSDCNPASESPGRNSPLAMRNPLFSYVTWRGTTTGGILVDPPNFTTTPRDENWQFALRGSFVPLTIPLAPGTTAILPQSMRFIDSLGQLAVVDGSSQGLILIDLDTVAFAHAPYF